MPATTSLHPEYESLLGALLMSGDICPGRRWKTKNDFIWALGYPATWNVPRPIEMERVLVQLTFLGISKEMRGALAAQVTTTTAPLVLARQLSHTIHIIELLEEALREGEEDSQQNEPYYVRAAEQLTQARKTEVTLRASELDARLAANARAERLTGLAGPEIIQNHLLPELRELLTCPATREVMQTPLLTKDGSTFDHSAFKSPVGTSTLGPQAGLQLINSPTDPAHVDDPGSECRGFSVNRNWVIQAMVDLLKEFSEGWVAAADSGSDDRGVAHTAATTEVEGVEFPVSGDSDRAHAFTRKFEAICACRISHDEIKDAVATVDGHSYDRGGIEGWLAGHRRSPATNVVLDDTSVVKNKLFARILIELLPKVKNIGSKPNLVWALSAVKEGRVAQEGRGSMPQLTDEQYIKILERLSTFARGRGEIYNHDNGEIAFVIEPSSRFDELKRYGLSLTGDERAGVIRGLLSDGHSSDEGYLSDSGQRCANHRFNRNRSLPDGGQSQHLDTTIEQIAKEYNLLIKDGLKPEKSILDIKIDKEQDKDIDEKLFQAAVRIGREDTLVGVKEKCPVDSFPSNAPSNPLRMTNIITLRTGEQVPVTVLITTSTALGTLMEMDPGALAELVAKCRDAHHIMCGQTQQKAKAYALLKPDGSMDHTVRSIIVALVRGEGMHIELVNPVHEQTSSGATGTTEPLAPTSPRLP